MSSNIDNARRLLLDAESFAATDPDGANAYTNVANGWLRLEEIIARKQLAEAINSFTMAFRNKTF